MTQAKVLDGGKMTLPPEVRRWLQIKDGDRISFIKDEQGVRIVNAGILALEKAQTALAGVAERVGIDDEAAVVALCREARKELYKERYADNG
ncbi:MAG: AbrB/MazE/SpoVT family DNA-binding domain-containing protein [Planctomycetota bacterium]|jgi:bifunctional DNA-binding transcriptional regulator/antitoxin component of YhaV-PrlF toxin-antitoxin module|nr:AbrB/MazE/SpoVT family DNA-binding domain-containing protein [Planctomycetota bacterium]